MRPSSLSSTAPPAQPVGRTLRILVLIVVFPLVLFALPSVYKNATQPWSVSMFSSRPSLTGTWAGTLSTRASGQAASHDAVMRLDVQTKYLTLGSHITGSVETCDAGGNRHRYTFNLGDVGKDNSISASLRDVDSATGGGSLSGIWSGESLEVTFRRREDTLQGTLTKGTQQTFTELCHQTTGSE